MARKRPSGSANRTPIASGLVDDRTFFAIDDLIRPLPSLPINEPSVVRSPLTSVEDNRLFGFGSEPVRSSRRWSVRTKLAPRPSPTRKSGRFDMHRLMFASPRFVIRCVRRKIRKEVLHAMMKTGKGSGSRLKRRKYHRNSYSGVHC